jgi:2-polyprenyl-3-methyl-5-hydroxy-6-metoxy-1,4-benzoquinol methylase
MGKENEYDDWHTKHHGEDDLAVVWYQFVIGAINNVADIEQKRILEIGCGRGGFSSYLANRKEGPKQIVASDYSASALKIAEQDYAHPKISWEKEDITSLSFAENSFDTIISCETIEHVQNPARAIQELYRVLRPGGKLFLTCPNYFNLFGIWCAYRWIIGKPFTEGGQPYVNYILMPRVYFWIRKVGFKVHQFSSSEIILPAKVPKHFYCKGTPWFLKYLGSRTFYILSK